MRDFLCEDVDDQTGDGDVDEAVLKVMRHSGFDWYTRHLCWQPGAHDVGLHVYGYGVGKKGRREQAACLALELASRMARGLRVPGQTLSSEAGEVAVEIIDLATDCESGGSDVEDADAPIPGLERALASVAGGLWRSASPDAASPDAARE